MSGPLEQGARFITVHVYYFASARAAAGTESEAVELLEGASVDELLNELRARHAEQLRRILTAASYLVDGVAVRDTSLTLTDRTRIDVLPPFAGG